MKLRWFLAALLLTNCGMFARETAYEALRALARERGQSLLNRVVEVKGTRGSPQPAVWTILVDEPSARGGTREFQVSAGQVVGERAPARDSGKRATIMNFKRLNLDSDGAFTVANGEAAKGKIGFDLVNYELRSDSARQVPVWLLQLTNSNGQILQNLVLSADTGAVLRRNAPAGPPRGDGDLPPDRSPRNDNPKSHSVPSDRRERSSDLQDDNEGDLGHEINKHIHRAGATVQEWITGRRTWDRKYHGEP